MEVLNKIYGNELDKEEINSGTGDINLAFNYEGVKEKPKRIPNKGEGYAVSKVECINGTADWDPTNWGLTNIKMTSNGNLTCNLTIVDGYNITILDNDHGSIKIDNYVAGPGEVINITEVMPNETNDFYNGIIIDYGTETEQVIDRNTMEFTMPNKNITITSKWATWLYSDGKQNIPFRKAYVWGNGGNVTFGSNYMQIIINATSSSYQSIESSNTVNLVNYSNLGIEFETILKGSADTFNSQIHFGISSVQNADPTTKYLEYYYGGMEEGKIINTTIDIKDYNGNYYIGFNLRSYGNNPTVRIYKIWLEY